MPELSFPPTVAITVPRFQPLGSRSDVTGGAEPSLSVMRAAYTTAQARRKEPPFAQLDDESPQRIAYVRTWPSRPVSTEVLPPPPPGNPTEQPAVVAGLKSQVSNRGPS